MRAAVTAKLSSEDGKACYAKRKQTIEPVFGHLKEQQGARRFLRRGMAACQAKWKLLCGGPASAVCRRFGERSRPSHAAATVRPRPRA